MPSFAHDLWLYVKLRKQLFPSIDYNAKLQNSVATHKYCPNWLNFFDDIFIGFMCQDSQVPHPVFESVKIKSTLLHIVYGAKLVVMGSERRK